MQRAVGTRRAGWAMVFASLLPMTVSAGSGDTNAAHIARELSDPVAPLINLPLEMTYDGDAGAQGEGYNLTLKAKPVIPIPVNDDWRVISRTILPLPYHHRSAAGESEFGLGDISQSFFFVPKGNGNITLGAGPVLLLPTATDEALGGKKWGAGPTAVAVVKSGGWRYGLLTSQTWSFAGANDRDAVNSLLVQPFVAYTTPEAWTYNLNSESTYEWDDGDAAIPVMATVSKLVSVGGQHVSLAGGVGYWLEHPDSGPDGWRFKLGMTFAFPE